MSTTGSLVRAETSLDAITHKGKLFPTAVKDNTGSAHYLSTRFLSKQYPRGSFISIQSQGSDFCSFVNVAFTAISLREFS